LQPDSWFDNLKPILTSGVVAFQMHLFDLVFQYTVPLQTLS
jgi:hypothetical protein